MLPISKIPYSGVFHQILWRFTAAQPVCQILACKFWRLCHSSVSGTVTTADQRNTFFTFINIANLSACFPHYFQGSKCLWYSNSKTLSLFEAWKCDIGFTCLVGSGIDTEKSLQQCESLVQCSPHVIYHCGGTFAIFPVVGSEYKLLHELSLVDWEAVGQLCKLFVVR